MADLVRGTSAWWLDRLGKKLDGRQAELKRLDDYYRGVQGLRFASTKFREAFGKTFEHYAENYCGLVVDAVEERLNVTGFRMGSEPSAEQADADAWRIWQDNELDAWSQIAHVESLVKGVCYVMVSPFEAERIAGRSPQVTIEDPLETIVEYAPGTRRRLVGMKRWRDDVSGFEFATLYFPDRIEKWRSEKTTVTLWANQHGRAFAERIVWVERAVDGEPWPLPHDLGVVPLVPLINRPRLTGEGESEIASVKPLQDAINKLAIDMLVAAEYGAFKQRWATGIEIPKDPVTGADLEPWKPGQDHFMSTAAPDAKFGQLEQTDLEPYVKAMDQKVQAIASSTRTPYHYFLRQGGQPPSGESLKSSETGLVAKAKRKHRHFGEGWEEVVRLAFRALGDARADILDSETIWANPESLTEAEHFDALVKLRSIEVPVEQLWEDAGYTPTQVARFKDMRAAEPAPRPQLDAADPSTSDREV